MCRRRRTHLSGAWKHALAGIQPRTAGILNLLDFRTTLANDATNEVVGDIDLLRLQLLRSTMRAASVWV